MNIIRSIDIKRWSVTVCELLALHVLGVALCGCIGSKCTNHEPSELPLPSHDISKASPQHADTFSQAIARNEAVDCTSLEGIEIVFATDHEKVPTRWANGEPISVSPVTLPEQNRTLEILQRAIAKYPSDMLHKSLDRIIVLGSMSVSDTAIAGTCFGKTVVLVNRGQHHPSYTGARIEKAFHHELASLLLKQHPQYLDQAAWHLANPEGFRYGGSGLEAVRRGQGSIVMQPSLLASGFLSEYSQATLDDDFCMMAGEMFMNQYWFWRAAHIHAKLGTKAMLVIKFYSAIDPQFSKEYFLHLLSD